MKWKKVKIFVFLVTLTSVIEKPEAQRSQADNKLRGHSFGLENFLFQTYEEVDIKDPIQNVKQKRIRPNFKVPTNGREQTYAVENFPYELNRLKPSPTKLNFETQNRKPLDRVTLSNKPREFFALQKEEPTQTSQTPVSEQQESIPTDKVTERIRKRIMMRRRKRPTNTTQVEDNSEVVGNVILNRIPISPINGRIVVRKKIPETNKKIIPISSKPLVSVPLEMVEQEITTRMEETTVYATKETITTEKPSTLNLKAFLKQQTETLSLSELLQTQNLSLADILRGNKDASAILRAKQAMSSTTPSSINLKRKAINREEETSKKTENIEVTTIRPNYNRFHPKTPRIKLEQTTSEPFKKIEENFEELQRPIKKITPNNGMGDPQNRLNELRMKLRNFQKKTTFLESTTAALEKKSTVEPLTSTTETQAHKKNRVSFKSANNPELSLILPGKPKLEPNVVKHQERIFNLTNRLPPIKRFNEEKVKEGENLIKNSIKVPIKSEETLTLEEAKVKATPSEVTPEELKKPEAKDELIELLKSGQNADRLQKILYSRNMTIQELLDNREKPPLQMNISELFSSSYRPEVEKKIPEPTVFESFPDFGLEDKTPIDVPDEIDYDEPFAEESARVELIASRKPKEFDLSIGKSDTDANLNLQPDDLKADTSNAENSALWKLSEKTIHYGSSYGYGEEVTVQQETEKSKIFEVKAFDSTPKIDIHDVSVLDNFHRSQNINRKYKLEYNDFVKEEEEEEEGPVAEDIEKSYIPPAVKSAIIASGVVMGIALFVFIAIFATCGWKQRQIRLKGTSSILSDTLTKATEKTKQTNSLSPVSFKGSRSYTKTLDFDEESSESDTSNTSSYLWNTLKHTFTSRTSTLKSRLEKEEKMKEDRTTLRRNESRRKFESKLDDNRSPFQTQEEKFCIKKLDRDRNVINTSFNFKRTSSNNSINRFDECIHGY